MPRTPWTARQIVVVVLSMVLGLAVAFVAFWFAVFLLPPSGFFASENKLGDRLLGAVSAVVVAVCAPGGLWLVALQRRNRTAGVVAAAIGAAVLLLAAYYALTTD